VPGRVTTAAPPGDVQARHLRGSQLLLLGRIVSLVLNFGVQVLTIRVLSKSDYSAFSFALAATGLASTAVLLGLNRGLARQVAILHELGDGAGMRVAIRRALVLVSVASGALLLLLFATGSERLVAVFDDELEVALLLVLAVLVPIQALDQLFQSLLSAFS
jgi:O-antigen/teichoic acid export membrane protein